jgi:Asp-tRNA(Asn)/Glu-tRNA(Gln) amidotransferase A subunit family amidase
MFYAPLRGGSMSTNTASFPIEETTIAALHAAYLSGRATAVSVCQAHLDRIAAYDRSGPALGAIIVNNPDALRMRPRWMLPWRRPAN